MTHSNVLNAAAAGVRARRRTQLEKLVCAGAHLLQPCQLDADIECILPCARRAMRGAYRAGARPRARCVVTKRPGGKIRLSKDRCYPWAAERPSLSLVFLC